MALDLVSLPTIGLVLIALGWFVQLLGPVVAPAKNGKKEKKSSLESYQLQKGFLAMYVIGVAFLVADGVSSGSLVPTALNVVCAMAALLLLVRSK